MTRIAIAGLALLASAGFVAGESALEMYQKLKSQVKAGACGDALKTLDAIELENGKPGHEQDRKSAAAPVAFYRGVCTAALGKRDEAKAQFSTFLTLAPNGTINPTIYPKEAVAAFEEAKKDLGAKQPSGGAAPTISASYAKFVMAAPPPAESFGEDWANGPVRALLGADEQRQFARLRDDTSRSEFIRGFWQARDSPRNGPFRQEFDRRVAFADATLGQDQTRGSLSERGMVFVLIGPPESVARRSLGGRDDRIRDGGINSLDQHDEQLANLNQQAGVRSATGTTTHEKTSDQMDNPASNAREATESWREVWHYSRELLPKNVPYGSVDFEFVTLRGQGKNVLEKNTTAVRTIDAAKKGVINDKT